MNARPFRTAVVVFLASVAAPAHAQLGASETNCIRQCGLPFSRAESPAGVRTLAFSNGAETIEISLVNGVAQRVAIEGPGMDDQRARAYMAANSDGRQWVAWSAPGQDPAASHSWMRSDDNAMAALSGRRLTVTAAAWNLRPPPPESPASPAASTAAPPATAAAPPPGPPVGYWLLDPRDAPPAALQFREDGSVSWLRRTAEGRWRSETAWRASPAGDRWILSASDGRPVATCETVGTDVLRMTRDPLQRSRAPGRETVIDGEMLLFGRVDALPTWRVQPPSAQPRPGDSRRRALQLLGRPSGTFRGARGEILLYPWGQVVLTNGCVQAVN